MLLNRGPYGGKPLVKRALIVAPSSLVGNWENEFLRWLGRDKLRLFSVDQVGLLYLPSKFDLNISYTFIFK